MGLCMDLLGMGLWLILFMDRVGVNRGNIK